MNYSFKLNRHIIIVIVWHFHFDFSCRMQLTKCDEWSFHVYIQSKNLVHLDHKSASNSNSSFHLLCFSLFILSPEARHWHLKWGFSPSSVSCNLRSCQMWDYGWLFAKSVLSLCAQCNPNFNQCVYSTIWKRRPAYWRRQYWGEDGCVSPLSTLLRASNKLSNANDLPRSVHRTLHCINDSAVIF